MYKYIFIIIATLISLTGFSQVNKAKSIAYFEKASTNFDEQKYKIAIKYCDSAIVTDAENLEAYAYRGVSNFYLKKYETAIKDFDLALILNNGYAEVYYYRGLSMLELGAKKKACEDFYEAYNLDFKDVMKIIEANCELDDKGKKKEQNK